GISSAYYATTQNRLIASSDIGKADVSVQARVFIGRQVEDSGGIPGISPLIGIFTHNPWWVYKWSLVLFDPGHADERLRLLDEESDSIAIQAQSSCTIPTGVWVTFNMTVYGTQATGSATSAGQTTCNVSGSFPSGTPGASGTGFGLYSGAYSALFDNVTVATVGPFNQQLLGFANAFIPGGAPGTAVHGAVAGTAELQNGVGSTPIETYYGYTSWGGLNQEKHRFDYQYPPGSMWLYSSRTYDSDGNPKTVVDYRGNTTWLDYSALYNHAYPTNVTQLLKPGLVHVTTRYGYNLTTGTTIWSYDPNHYNTTYKYDILGRLTSLTHTNSLGTTSYTYNDASNFVDITNSNGWKTRQIYDGLGRLAIVDRFLNGKSYSNQTTTYNYQNNVQSIRDPLGHQTSYTYDPIGRVVRTSKPDGNTTTVFYDDLDLIRYTYDESGVSREFFYDAVGRLIDVGLHSSNGISYDITRYTYDQVGNLVSTTDSNQLWTSYNYDNLNRLVTTTHADFSSETYAYDADGNVIMKTDRNSVKTLFAYDSLNRPITTTYCGTPTTSISYVYDSDGNILQLQNQNGTVFYKYDARSRITNETYLVNPATRQVVDLGCSGNGGTWTVSGGTSKTYKTLYSYTYDAQTSITYPDSSIFTFAYDGLGRQTNVTSSKLPYTKLTYYSNDQVKSVVYGNGLTGNYTYDVLSRPRNSTVYNGSSKLMSLVYSYNRTGTVLSVKGQVNGVSDTELYKYDMVSRLTNSTITLGAASTKLLYTYDSMGNRLQQNSNNVLTSYSYNSVTSALKSSSTPGTNTTYGYDLDGRLVSRNVTSGGPVRWTYSWSVPGDLLKVASNGATQGSYAYDAQGRRIESVESSTTKFNAYIGTETLAEILSSGTQTNYVFLGGLRVAKVSGNTVNYFHPDPLGSTRLVTTSSKSVSFSDSYLPFGQDNGTPTGSETYKFTGKPYSSATGLYYYFQRWYDPSIGRFISQDPLPGELVNPQSLNPYVYVQSLPTALVDPTGTTGQECGNESCAGGGP
ncbi:RHS repeat protein, partial [Candidatus Bathyarchaeota archaeon]|nr:RHS repeat protein [Candidatus Bathyarchaeota archaeon]